MSFSGEDDLDKNNNRTPSIIRNSRVVRKKIHQKDNCQNKEQLLCQNAYLSCEKDKIMPFDEIFGVSSNYINIFVSDSIQQLCQLFGYRGESIGQVQQRNDCGASSKVGLEAIHSDFETPTSN